MDGSYLPPVVSRLLADVSDFVAGWEEAAEAAETNAARIEAAQDSVGGPDGTGPNTGTGDEASSATESVTEETAANEALSASAADATGELQQEAAANDVLAGSAEAAGSASSDAAGDNEEYGASAADAAEDATELSAANGVLTGSMGTAGAAVADTTGDLDEYTASAAAATAASTSLHGGALIVGSALDDVADSLVSVRPGFDETGQAIKETGNSIRSMVGQAGAAKQGLDELNDTAEETARGAEDAGEEVEKTGNKVRRAGQDAEESVGGWRSLLQYATEMPEAVDGVSAAIGLLGPIAVGASVGLAAIATGGLLALAGMDGIEQAANQLDAALGPIKEAASQAFEKTLFPAVDEVSKVMPQMTQGVTDASTAVGGMVKSVVDVGTSAEGVQKLNEWLEGTADYFKEGERGASDLADAWLTFLAAASPAMQHFGADFADVMTDFDHMIHDAANLDIIPKAVEGAGDAFKGLGELVTRVAEALMKLAADVGPDVGDTFKDIGDAIVAIEPPLAMFIKGFTEGIEVIAKIVQAAEGIAEPFSVISGLLAAIGIGFAVFKWVVGPIAQTAMLVAKLTDALLGTKAATLFVAKLTDAIGLTEGAALKAEKAMKAKAVADVADGEAAEKGAKANAEYAASLEGQSKVAGTAAKSIDVVAASIVAEGEAAKVGTKTNLEYAASLDAKGVASKAATGEITATGGAIAAEGAAAKTATTETETLTAAQGASAEAGAAAGAGAAEAGVGATAAGAGAAGAAEGVGVFGGALTALTGPVGLAVAAVAVLAVAGYELVKNWDTVGPALSKAGDAIKSGLGDAIDSVEQQMKAWPQETGKELGDIAASFAKLADYVANQWPHSWAQAGQNVEDSVKDIATNVEESWSDMTGNIEASTKDWGDFLTQTVPDILGGFVKGIENGAGDIADAFGKLADSAQGEFKKDMGIQSPSTVFAGFGSNIVQGLAQGVANGASGAINAIVQVAANMLAAARAALGIYSPSTVFAEMVGEHIPAGVGQGIIRNAAAATDASRRMALATVGAASGAVGAGSGGFGGGPGTSGSGGSQTFTLNIGSGADSVMGTAISKLARSGQLTITANAVR